MGIAVDPVTDTVYASTGTSLAVINGVTDTITHTIRLHAVGPIESLAVNPTTNIVYAGSRYAIAVISGDTRSKVKSIPMATGVVSVAVNPTTDTVYTSSGVSITAINSSINAKATTVPVKAFWLAVDPATNTILGTAPNHVVTLSNFGVESRGSQSRFVLWFSAAGFVIIIGAATLVLRVRLRRPRNATS